mgnify:CR=1 FL=1
MSKFRPFLLPFALIHGALPIFGCSVAYVAPPQPNSLDRDTAAADCADTACLPNDSAETTDSAEPTDDSAVETVTPACTDYAEPAQTGTVVDADLNEISGIAASHKNPGVLWVLEGHLAPNGVVAIDTAGNTLGRVVLDGAINNDWEDLAVGPCGDDKCLFVGEIGDNNLVRPWHGVYRFSEPVVDLGGGLDLLVTAELFEYVFPDGTYNVEAMAILPDGRPVLFTKEYDTDLSTAYSFPSLDTSQVAVLTRHGRFATGDAAEGEIEGGAAAVTGASLWEDGAALLLRTYGHVWKFGLESPDTAGLDLLEFSERVELQTGAERQGESISYDPNSGGFFTISEDINPPVWFNACDDGA